MWRPGEANYHTLQIMIAYCICAGNDRVLGETYFGNGTGLVELIVRDVYAAFISVPHH